MARPRKPWFRTDRDAWFVEVNKRQILLARGKGNKQQAIARFHELMVEFAQRAAILGPSAFVGAVLDEHLRYCEPRDAKSTFYERRL